MKLLATAFVALLGVSATAARASESCIAGEVKLGDGSKLCIEKIDVVVTIDNMERVCADALKFRGYDEHASVYLANMFKSLRDANFDQAQSLADAATRSRPSRVQKDCIADAKEKMPVLKTAVAAQRQLAETRQAEEQEAERRRLEHEAESRRQMTAEPQRAQGQQNSDPASECELLVLQLGKSIALDAAPKCRSILEVQEARRRQELANRPPAERLEDVYRAYLIAKDCYEIRKELEAPYVTRGQFEIVRDTARRKEDELVMQTPSLSSAKDGVWETAVRKHQQKGPTFRTSTYSKAAHELCQLVVAEFRTEAERSGKLKKDF